MASLAVSEYHEESDKGCHVTCRTLRIRELPLRRNAFACWPEKLLRKVLFLALDGALKETGGLSLRGEISQTITGLHVGEPTTIEFEWAAAQQAGFTGPNTEKLEVSLGSQTMTTAVIMNNSMGFQPWRKAEFTFTPSATSEVLSFLAIGTPEVGVGSAGPPFVLLDGAIHLQAVPEPGTWLLLGISFAAIAGLAYRRPNWVRS